MSLETPRHEKILSLGYSSLLCRNCGYDKRSIKIYIQILSPVIMYTENVKNLISNKMYHQTFESNENFRFLICIIISPMNS